MTRRFDNSRRQLDRALKTIPLGTQTFSKSTMNFVEGSSPLFLDRGAGGRVWDVDGNEYIDYVLGLLPVVLGYCDPNVDAAIRMQLDKGISFSLATELEADLAERLVRLVPCAEMVRFGKNGSDATTGAIRLARACTGRDRIALCGYHGWHDWYIGTTSRNLGVPQAVRELSSKFTYNDASSLEELLCSDPGGFAAVVLEPVGGVEPAPGFLRRLRELTEQYGALLIFDEIVTGFRIDLGGAQKVYDVVPDLACFGKAMGNGMPISAVVGRAEYMRLMEEIFFSGTFGGEALSLAASIATIDKLEHEDGIAQTQAAGRKLAAGASERLRAHGLDEYLGVGGADWRPTVSLKPSPVPAHIAVSLFRQELIAEGLLMGGAFNLCLAHAEDEILDDTLARFGRACETAAAAFNDAEPERHLKGRPIQPVFQVRAQ
jgi:glutamate-1-semialdehyde 2,1-aminomutase